MPHGSVVAPEKNSAVEVPRMSRAKNFSCQCLSYCLKKLKKGHGFYESADGAWKFRCRWGLAKIFWGATAPLGPLLVPSLAWIIPSRYCISDARFSVSNKTRKICYRILKLTLNEKSYTLN